MKPKISIHLPSLEDSHVSRKDFVERAGVDTAKVDFAVPQSFFDSAENTDPMGYVWDYRTNSTFGEPLGLSSLKDFHAKAAESALTDFNRKPSVDALRHLTHLCECLPKEQVDCLRARFSQNATEWLTAYLKVAV